VIVGVAGFWANVRNTNKTTALALQGQVTDRYTKAIEQLGSKEMDVRMGGIYALERIARDSARDYSTVMEVLAAFVREHSLEQWPLPAIYEPAAELPERRTRPDVQAALTVIGRQGIRIDPLTDLPQEINLNHANLARAELSGADLTYADLRDANLASAALRSADLTGARLARADLTGADLADANLTAASLASADLTGADLREAALRRANLRGANLAGADLRDVDLTGAFRASDDAVPEGWERDADSGKLRRVAPTAETERNQTE